MSARHELGLDHFYVNLNRAEFESIKKISTHFRWASHSVVKTTAEEWEGVYIFSRLGIYFEALMENVPGCLGICVSARNPFYFDGRKIRDDYPQLDWYSSEKKNPDGTLWFESLSTRDDSEGKKVLFNCWLMHTFANYGNLSRENPPKTPSVDHYHRMKMTVGKKWVREITEVCQWLPGKLVQNERQISLFIPGKDSLELEIQLILVDVDQDFRFESLEFATMRLGPVAEEFKYSDDFFTAEVSNGTGFIRRQLPSAGL